MERRYGRVGGLYSAVDADDDCARALVRSLSRAAQYTATLSWLQRRRRSAYRGDGVAYEQAHFEQDLAADPNRPFVRGGHFSEGHSAGSDFDLRLDRNWNRIVYRKKTSSTRAHSRLRYAPAATNSLAPRRAQTNQTASLLRRLSDRGDG